MNFKNLTQALIVSIILLIPKYGAAQCMLNEKYTTVKQNYDSKAKYTDWKEGATDDGTPYISYWDKEQGVGVFCYLSEGVVTQYKMIGKAKEWANSWGEYFDKNFAVQGGNKWIDYASQQVWRLRIEDDYAIVWTYKKAD